MSRLPVAVTTFVALLILVTLAVTSAASKPPPKASPVNTALPSISGTPAVGSMLQASSGAWQGVGISYSFQWQRCSSSSSCVAISGATGSSYATAAADAGDTLKVGVTAQNRYGSATATSTQTASVPSASPSPSPSYTNTALPAISGPAQSGQTLTVSNGSWSPTTSTFRYAWHRCQNGSCSLSPTTANQATYSVQPGDVGYSIVAQVAPDGNWSDAVDANSTATVTSAPAPPPPPPPSGTVGFDGRANQMTQLFSTSPTNQGQSPNTWTCLCFINNDIQLASDGAFGKVYDANVRTGDSNGFGGTGPSVGAAQLSIRRSNDLGKWDYFAGAVKVNSWNGPMSDLYYVDLWSLGFQTSEGDQVALRLWNGPNDAGPLQFSISQNAGYINSPNSYAPGTTSYEQAFKNVTYGQWEEFVVGVKWATDNTGEVQVYNRQPGGSWAKAFDKANVSTYVYGSTQDGTFAQNGSNWPTVIDKIGLYFDEYGGESEAVQESGLTRSSDLATAESTLP